MTNLSFQAGGPLPSNSPAYIERKADREAMQLLLQMEYVQLTEPRQQGKTSLLHRLRGPLRDMGYALAYVDAESLKSKSEAEWYQDLAARLVNQFKGWVNCSQLSAPSDASTWRLFLSQLGASESNSSQANPRLIMALDEVGSIPPGWAEGFFRVLREVYVVREIETQFSGLSFVLAGAFDPRDLIRDPDISPFNVAQRVNITDLDLGQVKSLASRFAGADQSDSVANRLYYWTDGQPFLTQKLCVYLAESGTTLAPDTVDAVVDHLFQDDVNHLPRISKDLEADPALLGYVERVVTEKVKFTPAINPQHFRLAYVIGVIKPDESGCCRIRNRIYERALAAIASADLVKHPREKQVDPSKLYNILTEHFNEGELRDLCFHLGTDYDSLPAQGTGNKARELVMYFDRQMRTHELVAACRQQRPNAFQ